MNKQWVERRVKELSPWYHRIDLGDGVVTPGREYTRIWSAIRRVMDQIDYTGKDVIDLGSWDGMWAFEAEKRGAKRVVSTDTRSVGAENLLFCKQVLGSKVFPLFNAPIQELPNRLKISGFDPMFDIVHHLGLLYHLRDPMLSLTQARAVMRDGGILILETMGILGDDRPIMVLNGVPDHFHFGGNSDTWAPTRKCLEYMLIRSRFEPVLMEHWQETGGTVDWTKDKIATGRITVVAKAVPGDNLHRIDREKLDGNQ